MLNNVTVVIRSVGERTSKACYNAIAGQVSEDNIFVVNKTPFSEAVRANFEIGINQNLPWTLSVDADLILSENAVRSMVDAFSKLKGNYFIYQGWVYDKFFNGFRTGGPHLYRTSLLEQAITYLPHKDSNLRPESSIYVEMQKLGYGYYVDKTYFGLHDFEQSKRDIYRKFFLHAKKHKTQLKRFLDTWKDRILIDNDFIYALKGLADGLTYKGDVYVDKHFFDEKYNTFYADFNIEEKTLEIDDQVFKEYFFLAEETLAKTKNLLHVDDNGMLKKDNKVNLLDKIKIKVAKVVKKSGV
ncbi:hypothetical protein [Hyunsoonleella pacifica]|uniref:Glycosyltransferase family 2 protein n=1 Tax=Hyunsoonleella pacifica TaxID=1080224 RepID=A0A4Q9FR29_9FLAO|nr:hypothetical protein [Hyunsoonleella pacifica]TBN18508.1 hypothetical protein EYD46_00120 [Hyunsoonleella pacifica]GGD02390.1 hypothetical protein GCM10011368_00250 [Hyunsoonleella pacifica]